MNCKITKLDNGLRILIVEMPSSESVNVTIWVKTGSRYEDKRINGISHFLEHMVFKGSPKRPSAFKISEAVDAIGGEFNAATSKEWTNFYIKSAVGNVDLAFDVLSDMVLNPLLNSDEIEREKGTIIQELAMYEDTPTIKINDIFEELVFSGNPLGWDVGGTPMSVKAIKRDDFLNYRNTHYYPENMLVTVAGGITEEKTLELARKYFSQINNQKPKTKKIISEFKSKLIKPQMMLKFKQSDQAHFILGFRGDGREYKNRFAQSVLSALLNGGMSSRLFIEVRERRGLAYAVKPASDRFDETGYFGVYAGTDPNKAQEAVKIILDQMYGLRDLKFKISEPELKKAKEFIKGHIALSLEDSGSVVDFFGEQELFLKDVLTPEQVFEKIDKVSKEDVLSEAKRLFQPERLNLAIIGPYKNDASFVKLLR